MEKIVKMEHVNKSFPGVQALKDVSLELREGEVLALMGENGAGKSTLMKILCGDYSRDSGTITVFGQNIEAMTPARAQELGIAIIHQELNLCPHLTVAQNIFLGREKTVRGILSDREMHDQTAALLRRLDINLSPKTIVGDLPVSAQQLVEICKALSKNARILIMDEPTSALASDEISQLFTIIKQLRSEGRGIIYISHRMDELHQIADRVMIMRDGEYVTSMKFCDTTMEQIITNMVGHEIKEQYPRVTCQVGKPLLKVENLNAGSQVRDINFEVHQGEIVGVAGLIGAGRTETMRAIFGIDTKEEGSVFLDGKKVVINSPQDAINAGIVLVPEDRKREGLCTRLSVSNNVSLPNLDWLSNRFGVVNSRKEKKIGSQVIKDMNVKVSDADVDAETLSGGNQQKVVLGKWLARNSRVVILDEPTRGIDVAAKVEIYNLMNRLKKQGIGVLFVSSEMTEVMGMSDRIIVMCDGRITGDFDRKDASQDLVMTYATKFEERI
jgi:ribose transport system ATP-binding protein